MDTLPQEGTLAWELMKAHEHAANVLKHVYSTEKRTRPGWIWRQQMLRAESILMKLMIRELSRRKPDEEEGLPQPIIPDTGAKSR